MRLGWWRGATALWAGSLDAELKIEDLGNSRRFRVENGKEVGS